MPSGQIVAILRWRVFYNNLFEVLLLKHVHTLKKYYPHLRKVISSALACSYKIGFAILGLGNELYVIGAVIGPGRQNLDIQHLSDVDILRVKNERAIWRLATPMTRCRGTIVGCTILRI